MYSLVLDESGTHAGAPVLLVAGLAIHESDVRQLEENIHQVLDGLLRPLGLDPYDYEAHAGELKTPNHARRRPDGRMRPASPWVTIDSAVRLKVLDEVYEVISTWRPASEEFPTRMFGAVIDRRNKSQPKAERQAYEHVLHRFDEMLAIVSAASGVEQRGIVLHDRRDGYDKTVQDLAAKWQRATGPSKIDRLVHVPVFADSRVSRLIQAADFISYALWRYYNNTEDAKLTPLWQLAGRGESGELVDVVHKCPEFGSKTCQCEPCTSRY